MKEEAMTKKESLICSDLERCQDFLDNTKNAGKRGIYIYGFRFINPTSDETTPFIPYYVGKHHKDIQKRIQEHICGLEEGTHKILRKELLLGERPWMHFRSQLVSDHVYLNRKIFNGPKKNMSDEERHELTPHIDIYIKCMSIVFIEVPDGFRPEGEINKYIDKLEGYIQRKIEWYYHEKVGVKDRKRVLASRPGQALVDDNLHILPGKGMENIFPID
jgi:hypothetical protein